MSLATALTAGPAAAAGPAASAESAPGNAASADCLADRLRKAPDSATVRELRIACDQAAGSNSPIQQRFAGELGLAIDRLGFLPHRPNYLMPASWARGFSTDEASSRSLEVQFQVSLKMPFTLPALRGRPDLPVLFFAYTGTAWWQAYDQDRSSPFREYNHAPELFMQWPLNRSFGGLTARKLDTGFEHQSNGRPAPRSRSWNRLFAQIDFDYRERYWVSLRSWWRIPEDAKPFEGAADGDDNPDILRYLGYGALRFGYAGPSLSWNAMLRHGLRHGGKGALEVNVSYPTGFNPRTRWLLRWFDGYGDSLVDYNRRVQRLGIGLMLNDWY